MTDSKTKDICEKIERAAANLRASAGGRKVFALMSGGLDSSVAVMLALRAGLDVEGVTMRQTEDESQAQTAADLCRALGIPSRVFDLRLEFKRRVIEPFKASYMRGETPNPCAICNVSVKFGLLWERIAESLVDSDFYVMTGHYAITARIGEEIALSRGVDRGKDQSYFLCMLPYERVKRLLLPLGEQTKAETRAMAGQLNAPGRILNEIAEKPESMDICFLQAGGYREELRASDRPGAILNTRGEKIGTHGGIGNFTVGQRKGIGITSRKPLFVTEIRPESGDVVVAGRDEAMTREVRAVDMNILAPGAYRRGARLGGKIRSQANPSPCRIEITEASELTAIFDAPQFAPAPGQYIALYDEDRVAAGGRIRR